MRPSWLAVRTRCQAVKICGAEALLADCEALRTSLVAVRLNWLNFRPNWPS